MLDKIIKALNGVAAVNLNEPSEGDLVRISKAYRLEREKVTILIEALEDAEAALISAMDNINHYYDHQCIPTFTEVDEINKAVVKITTFLIEKT